MAYATDLGFGCNSMGYAANQCGVPCSSQSYCLRKSSGAFPHQSMQCFIKSNDGNTQPGFLNKIFLYGINLPGQCRSVFNGAVTEYLLRRIPVFGRSTYLETKNAILILG